MNPKSSFAESEGFLRFSLRPSPQGDLESQPQFFSNSEEIHKSL